MLEKILAVVVGSGALVTLFIKYGLPLFVRLAKTKIKSVKIKEAIHDIVPLLVDIAEICGDKFDWKGEEKTLCVLRALEKEIGVQLKPTEVQLIRAAVNDIVREKNSKAGSLATGRSFVASIEKKLNDKGK